MGVSGGRGRRNRFFATGVPFSAYAGREPGVTLDPNEELPMLKKESARLKSMLEAVEKRLRQLESE